MIIMKGAPVAKIFNEETVDLIEKHGLKPCLAVVRLGDREEDLSYIRGVTKSAEKNGITVKRVDLSEKISTEDLKKVITGLNEDEEVDGMLILRPLPKHIDSGIIERTISVDKDPDCMNPENLGKVLMGIDSEVYPATAKAGIEILKHYGIETASKNVLVINRSNVLGRPIAMMLLKENSTVTIAHSRTKNLDGKLKENNIIISAVGKPGIINSGSLNEESVVVDIGMGVDENGELKGDLNIETANIKAASPIFGGVGSITNSILLNQMVKQSISRKNK